MNMKRFWSTFLFRMENLHLPDTSVLFFFLIGSRASIFNGITAVIRATAWQNLYIYCNFPGTISFCRNQSDESNRNTGRTTISASFCHFSWHRIMALIYYCLGHEGKQFQKLPLSLPHTPILRPKKGCLNSPVCPLQLHFQGREINNGISVEPVYLLWAGSGSRFYDLASDAFSLIEEGCDKISGLWVTKSAQILI